MEKIRSVLPKLLTMGFAFVLGLTPATAYAAENGSQEDSTNSGIYTVHWNDAYGYMHSFECDTVEQVLSAMGNDNLLGNRNPNYELWEQSFLNEEVCNNSYWVYDYDYENHRYVELVPKEERKQVFRRTFNEEEWVDQDGKLKEAFYDSLEYKKSRYEIHTNYDHIDHCSDVFDGKPIDGFAKDTYLIFKYKQKTIPIDVVGEEFGTVDFSVNFERYDYKQTSSNEDSSLDGENIFAERDNFLEMSDTWDLSTSYYMEHENGRYIFDDWADIVYFTVDWVEDYETVSVTCDEAQFVRLIEDTKTGKTCYEMFFETPPEGTKRTSATIKLEASNPKKPAPVVPSETPEEPTPTNHTDDIDMDRISNLFPIVLVVALLAGGTYFFFFLPRKKIKIRGVWEEEYVNGIDVKGPTSKENPQLWYVPAMLHGSENRVEFVNKLIACRTYSYFPADTVITLVTADGFMTVKDETALFEKIASCDQITAVTFASESKGFRYSVNIK